MKIYEHIDVILLMDKILLHLGCPKDFFLPVSRLFGASQVVQDFFHQQYGVI